MSAPLAVLHDGRRRPWFAAPNAIWEVPGLSAHAILVYLYLRRCAGTGRTCWPARTTIARACRISVDSVDRALRQLCDLGLVAKEPRHRPDGGSRSNVYVLFDPPSPATAPLPEGAFDRQPHPLAAVSGHPQLPAARRGAAESGPGGRTARHEEHTSEEDSTRQQQPAPLRDDDALRAQAEVEAARRQAAAAADPQAAALVPDEPARLAAAYHEITGYTLSRREAAYIVRRWGLSYALEKLQLVAWQRERGGFERSPKAYFLAALKGDWRREEHVPERVQRRLEEERRREEAARRMEEERRRLEAERREAAALDAWIASLPEPERRRLEAEAEARVRQRLGERLRQIGAAARMLVLIELRSLARRRWGLVPAACPVSA
ncbi:MAG TPA: helix-turn-helix domain-containing protein [Thermaerobacter sp.]